VNDTATRKLTGRSESTRALIKERALERGKERSEEFEKHVRSVMEIIERELADTENKYPHYKGDLSLNELARRANVHPTTFFSPKQREFGLEVKKWLGEIKTGKVIGRGAVRRDLAERIADWKALYDSLAQSHRDTELELQQTEADLIKARAAIETLQREKDQLQKILNEVSDRKVVLLNLPKD
jgi:AraC-like DNA-binding protein